MVDGGGEEEDSDSHYFSLNIFYLEFTNSLP